MSHETRTLLKGIIGMADLILENDFTSDQYNYARIVQESGRELLSVIIDILDYAKIESGRFEIECIAFFMAASVQSHVATFGPKAKDYNLVLTSHIAKDVQPLVQGDPGRIGRVLGNTISNAIRFLQSGLITLEVRTQATAAVANTVRFDVTDTKIGIDTDVQRRLF